MPLSVRIMVTIKKQKSVSRLFVHVYIYVYYILIGFFKLANIDVSISLKTPVWPRCSAHVSLKVKYWQSRSCTVCSISLLPAPFQSSNVLLCCHRSHLIFCSKLCPDYSQRCLTVTSVTVDEHRHRWLLWKRLDYHLVLTG